MKNTENMTLSISKETAKKMKRFRQIRWSAVANSAIEKEISRMEDLEHFEGLESILARSRLTKGDAEKIGRKVKAGIGKRL
ncbi:MAG TPA: hypothetical protein VND15_01050 [Candidatus Acidoferrales bacterium]|nr:hypothetical protein [Candidatus Acidoferrales bacterium]